MNRVSFPCPAPGAWPVLLNTLGSGKGGWGRVQLTLAPPEPTMANVASTEAGGAEDEAEAVVQ